ncbi:hypothetical protein C8R44DRAFT_866477 [Mycena epipterygia]|nr:hypothetical protein C8R44DRAFT_866477 [Mycena epipterygia]
MSSLPNEIWLHIFALIKDEVTLKAILSTSYRFHALGLEEVLCAPVWNTAIKMYNRLLDLLDSPEKGMILRVLSMTLDSDFHAGEVMDKRSRLPHIVYWKEENHMRCMSLFSNLTSLTITGGQNFPFYFDTFRQLRRLTLERDLTVTKLSLHDVLLCRGEFHIRADGRLVAFSNSLPMPRDPLRRLQELAITTSFYITSVEQEVASFLDCALPRRDHPRIIARVLRVLPYSTARAELAELTVSDPLAPAPALELLDTLNSNPIRSLALTLSDQNPSVLRALAHRLPHPERISLIYRYGAPVPVRHPLPPPSASHVAHARASPPRGAPAPRRRQYHGYSDYMGAYRAWEVDVLRRAAPLSDAQCRVFLDAWASRCPRLRVVGLAPGKLWCRMGNEWEVQDSRADGDECSG